jgi:hypothetical protein
MSVIIPGAARPPASDARGNGGLESDSVSPPPPDTRRTVSTFRFFRHIADESPAAKYSGHNCHACTGGPRRCAQLANKIVEVTPPPCVAGVSSSGDEITTLTAHIDELARQVFALSASLSRPRLPLQTRRHARRSSRCAGRSQLLVAPPF